MKNAELARQRAQALSVLQPCHPRHVLCSRWQDVSLQVLSQFFSHALSFESQKQADDGDGEREHLFVLKDREATQTEEVNQK